jgi:hypothetical protein
MQKRRCQSCGRVSAPKAQAPGQRNCEDQRCEREWRRCWQENKRKSDADYRDNESRAQRLWTEHHPDYWRKYRREYPASAERNRQQQRCRDRRRRWAAREPTMLVNEDDSGEPRGFGSTKTLWKIEDPQAATHKCPYFKLVSITYWSALRRSGGRGRALVRNFTRTASAWSRESGTSSRRIGLAILHTGRAETYHQYGDLTWPRPSALPVFPREEN